MLSIALRRIDSLIGQFCFLSRARTLLGSALIILQSQNNRAKRASSDQRVLLTKKSKSLWSAGLLAIHSRSRAFFCLMSSPVSRIAFSALDSRRLIGCRLPRWLSSTSQYSRPSESAAAKILFVEPCRHHNATTPRGVVFGKAWVSYMMSPLREYRESGLL